MPESPSDGAPAAPPQSDSVNSARQTRADRLLATASLQLWGGIECTVNRVGDRYHDQLALSGFRERLDDLDRIAALGIRTLRFPLLWETLAPESLARIDWSRADREMARLRELGIQPIVGLVHHGSGPRYTSLVDPHFPQLLARYARAVAERYPWVTAFTPINEPLTTARFSALYGHWYPHARDPLAFSRTLLLQVRAVGLAMKAIREVIPEALLVQTEDLGQITSSPELRYQAEFENERRWLPFDLLCGSFDRQGAAASYLRWAGVEDRELRVFSEEPCPPDVIGINHYVTSSRYLDANLDRYPDWQHGGNGRHAYVDADAARARPEGFCEPHALLREAWDRYQRPLAITEAHLSCTREEQLRWFGEMWRAAEAARRAGAKVIAVTAWSLFGAYNWNSLLTRNENHYEPGAWDLRAPVPRATALAGALREVAQTGAPNHPLLRAPGWWRRRIRHLRIGPPGDDLRDHVRFAFEPAADERVGATPCPLILITGATGTLGQAFARICYLRGLPYRLLTRAELDIASSSSVRAALQTWQPWAVINAAGYVRVDDAEHDEERCFRENARGPETLAAACARANVRLITFSSDLVFDGRAPAPYTESDQINPLNAYGRSKAAAERAVAACNPDALIIRTSAFFGPWDSYNFITQTIARLANQEAVIAPEDTYVSPTYVPDLVHAALDLLIDGERGIVHLANRGCVTWAELARNAARLAGLKVELVKGCAQADLRLPAVRPTRSVLRSDRTDLLPDLQHALETYFRERVVPAGHPAETAELPELRSECAA